MGHGEVLLSFDSRSTTPPSASTSSTASAEELRAVAESYAGTSGAGRPRGLGIFVPPHEERQRKD